MRTIQPGGGEMKAITISRQNGSGGGEVGARLAERLNRSTPAWACSLPSM